MPILRQLRGLGLATVLAFGLSALGPQAIAQQGQPAGASEQSGPATAQAGPAAPQSSGPLAAQASGSEPRANPISDSIYTDIFKALFAVLVMAVVLESALALIFNWRPFLLYFDGRGVRSLISFAFAFAIAVGLKMDLVNELNRALGRGASEPSPVGYFVTALVIAGGSAAVNTILRALGFRDVLTREDVSPKPPVERAWLAVRVKRVKITKAQIRVFVQQDGLEERLVGMVTGLKSPPPLLAPLFRDGLKFPSVGGLSVPGDVTYVVRIEAEDPEGHTQRSSWGPFSVAKGAVIDVALAL